MMKFSVVLVACLAAFVASEWVKEMENPGVYEGDMVLSPEQTEEALRGEFQFASTKNRHWPSGVAIAYDVSAEIGRSGQAMSAIRAAIADYHRYTCIRFKRRSSERAYLYFYKGGGCSSPVGYSGGKNSISLASGCWRKGTVMHEIGHSLGLFHEQSRPDRDDHVTIIWGNINQRAKFNFNKQPYSNINSLGTDYDYLSMMHYGRTAFSVNGRDTIYTRDRSMQSRIGQRGGFSEIDKRQINLMYRCRVGKK